MFSSNLKHLLEEYSQELESVKIRLKKLEEDAEWISSLREKYEKVEKRQHIINLKNKAEERAAENYER